MVTVATLPTQSAQSTVLATGLQGVALSWWMTPSLKYSGFFLQAASLSPPSLLQQH